MTHTIESRMITTRFHGGNFWHLIRERGIPKRNILDFSADMNPLGPPEGVGAIIHEHVSDVAHYPDPEAHLLREAIGTLHDVPLETVLAGNGSAELINLIAHRYARSQALVCAPTFTEYAWAAEHNGAQVIHALTSEHDDFQFHLKDVLAHCEGTPEVVFLCNPNNPTGSLVPKDQILELAQRCHQMGSLLVVDEAYMDFVEQRDEASVVSEASSMENLVVLRSLTKGFAIPGLRLGYLVASEETVKILRGLQSPWPLNTFAMVVGVELLEQVDYIARTQELLCQLRREFHDAIAQDSILKPFPTTTNFTLCKIENPGITSAQLTRSLATQGVLIRNCDDFIGLKPQRFIRLAIRTREENERFLSRFREALRHGC